MPEFVLGKRSQDRLIGVHPHLIEVVTSAINMTNVDFTVVEGVRTSARQIELVKEGKSKTVNSRHLTGHAVDLAPWIDGKIPWDDLEAFKYLSMIMFRAAHLNSRVILWGGHFGTWTGEFWDSFFDGPHFELPWQMYPVTDKTS